MKPRRDAVAIGAALAAVALLAGGCATEKKELPNLPMACETTKCICTEVGLRIFQKEKEVPVEWRPTGEAFCPEGYVLRRAEK